MTNAPSLLALTLLATAPATATRTSAQNAAQGLSEAARIDAIVQKEMRGPGAVGLSVAVARGDEMVYAKAYGFADLEFTVNADEETMFRIGSVTKQFTAAAILKLAERGKLAVDDPLSKFLPDYPNGSEITLRHLLTHTSGVPNYTDLGPAWLDVVARELPDDKMVALWKDKQPDFAPGERWSYSNSGYFLLGMVVSKVSGESYADFLRETFFDPLKLTRTRYDSNAEVILNRAQGYGFADGKFSNDQLIGMSQPGAAGGLISSAGDLVRWEQALVSGKVIKPESFTEMTTPFLLNNGHETEYGMGLGLRKWNGQRCISHGGGIFGFNSALAYFPDAKLFVSVISNSEGLSAEGVAQALYKALLADAKGG